MTFRAQIAALGIAVLACSPMAQAQQTLVGTYKGSVPYVYAGAVEVNLHAILTITSAENGKISGTVNQGGECRGVYKVDGTYEGNKILLTQSTGPVKDCGGLKIELTAKGNVLEGTAGKTKIKLTKSKSAK